MNNLDIVLTKDADKMICTIYKAYLERRKSGVSKNQAKYFGDFEVWRKQLFPEQDLQDVQATVCEMTKAFGIKPYYNLGFVLNDEAIVYMENRFPKGIEQFLEIAGKVKDVFPFV